MTPLMAMLLNSYLVVIGMMVVLWGLSLLRQHASIVDPSCQAGFVVVTC